jgi:hypothetical protein
MWPIHLIEKKEAKMSKGHDGADKKKEITKEIHAGKEAASHGAKEGNKEGHKDAHAAHGGAKDAHAAGKEGHTGETKKPGEHKAPAAPMRGKAHTPMPDGCFSWGCKSKALRFNFCDEHYDHFKFGLIKKTGEPVSDYEKKIEHYMMHKSKTKKGSQKAA